MSLRSHADYITEHAIAACLPDRAVEKALASLELPSGRLILVAIGKAAWRMADAAHEALGSSISCGIVITKYGYSQGPIRDLRIFEAGHPVPDGNTYAAADEVISMVSGLGARDTVLFLVSGGGSALFEKPLCSPETVESVTEQLLARGADITEINTIRKRLSAVKGGRFAEICAPAKVFSIVLSDVLGDRLDTIASGPAYPDSSTSQEALAIAGKYALDLPPEALALLEKETPKALDNVETHVTGSVGELCLAAKRAAEELGYEALILTDSLACEASEAGWMLAETAKEHQSSAKSLCFIAGGETVVHLRGDGLGGRNQELALAAAKDIAGLSGTAVFSVGSDGTDGPTDAAGGFVDGDTWECLRSIGCDPEAALLNNDSYHALKKTGGLMVTGPTGTNVNDFAAVLIRRGSF